MIVDQVAEGAREAGQRLWRQVVVAGVIAVLGLGAAGFATAGAYMALAVALGAMNACLVLAAACVVAMLIVMLLARAPSHAPPPPPPPKAASSAGEHLLATFMAGVRAGRSGFSSGRA